MYILDLATDADDADLRRVLAATPMPGRIAVTFRREPRFFQPASSAFEQVVAARRAADGAIVGFGCRSIREMYVNGQARPIGYLSALRLLSEHRNLGLVARGYRFFHELHADGRTTLYLTTIAEGNDRALAILTSGRAGLPRYHFAGRYITSVVPLRAARRNGRHSGSVDVRPAIWEDRPIVLDFLRTLGPTRQFFPCVRAEDLFDDHGAFHGLRPVDLRLAFRDGRLVGTLGLWDQRPFRQTVVESYAGPLAWARPLYNAWAILRRRPTLPRPGGKFDYLTAALPLAANDDPAILAALLDSISADSAIGPTFLLVGLHETDPLLPAVAKRRATNYVTRLYHACWDDGEPLRRSLDARPPYLELGLL